eukprot:jgi/Bigna1/76461/fgenesh1_pg.41_\
MSILIIRPTAQHDGCTPWDFGLATMIICRKTSETEGILRTLVPSVLRTALVAVRRRHAPLSHVGDHGHDSVYGGALTPQFASSPTWWEVGHQACGQGGEGEESVYARLVTQAVTTKDASNKRAVEALVGGKVDWMDGNETAKLQNRLQDVRLNLEHPFWKFCLSSPEPATIELISNENLKVQALVVPIATTVIRHYPPGSFLMQKMVSGAGTRARVRSLIYSRVVVDAGSVKE